jgi:hypothetical protein
MHWADDAYCVPYDEPELLDELFDWEDYLFEGDADDEDISILCNVCYINADTIVDLIDN